MNCHRRLLSSCACAGALIVAGWVQAGTSPDEGLRSVTELQANTFTSNAQENPSVAVDPRSGCAFVVWGSRRQEDGGFGIFGRLIDSTGAPVGGEIHINTTFTNNQEKPAVTFAPDGSAWVAWQSFLQDFDQGAIAMRRFGFVDGVFTALSDEVLVNSRTAGDQTLPTIAASRDRVLVAWHTVADGVQHVAARLFDSEGNALDDEFRLSDDTTPEALPVLAAQPDNTFVAVWAARNANNTPRAILGRIIGANGEMPGAPFAVTDDEAANIEPAIAADAHGRFVVAWMRSHGRDGWDVVARRFAANGTPRGDVLTVAPREPNGWTSGVGVAMAGDGRFVVAYNREADSRLQLNEKKPYTPAEVFAQRFDARGRSVGSTFRVNVTADGRQTLPIALNATRLAWGPDDAITTAWQGETGADGSGIGVTRVRTGDRAMAAPLTEYTTDPTILAANTLTPATIVHRFPPEYDRNFKPEPPDPIVPNPGNDFGFQGFQNTGWNPPDPDIAVGPNHVVIAVNGGIRFYTKDGTLTYDDDIVGPDGFWGDLGAGSFVFDPVTVFDVQSQRYIVACTEHYNGNSSDSWITLAVSDDDDPNGTWHKYRFDFNAVGDFIDFPNLGVGPDAIYITSDYFSGNTGNRIHIFDKARALSGLSITPTVVTTSGGFRSLGAVNHLTSDAPAQYFATSFDGNNSQIGIDAIRDPNGTPIRDTFLLSVPSFSQPPDAAQLGSSNRVSTVDMRIKNGVYRDGILWLTHTIGEDNTARVRWYKIAMNGWPTSASNPQLLDSGTQDLGAGVHNWFGDVSVDEDGVVGIVFNQSSSSEYVSVQRTFRLPDDAPGTFRTPELMQESNSPEESSRWGDYAGVEQDPVQPAKFWSHHEYRTTSWRTWVGAFDLSDLAPIRFEYPLGLPESIDSDGGTTFLVQVLDQTGTAAGGTGVLWVDAGTGDAFQPFPMTDLGGNLYEAEFPPTECGTIVPFYVSAEDTQGTVVTDPDGAPNSFFTTESYASSGIILSDDFETDTGWTVNSQNLSDGEWERGVPAGDGTRGDPTSDFDGSGQAYLTANRLGNSDVDGGPTVLTSPLFDLSAATDAQVRYARWYFNDDGDDAFVTEVSNDDGASWTPVDSTVGGSGGWNVINFTPGDFVAPTSQMRVRFVVSDNPNNSVTEAAIDAFEVVAYDCAGGGTTELVDFTFRFGSHNSGGLLELEESDDTYLRGQSQFGFSATMPYIVDVIVGAETTVPNPDNIDLTFEGRLDTPGGDCSLRLFNWNTQQFESVRHFTIGTTEIVRVSLDDPATDRVRAGDGRIEVSTRIFTVSSFSVFGFEMFIDQLDVNVD